MIIDKYKIHHFDLATVRELPDFTGSRAHYVVFWYRSYPLGDRYIIQDRAMKEDAFWRECLESIWMTLVFYYERTHPAGTLQKPKYANAVNVKFTCDLVLESDHPAVVGGRCDVSVVICTRNRSRSLKNCLEQLQKQYCKPAEVIVVDNGSSTQDTQRVAEQFSSVKYIREDRPGLDIARNRGANEAKSSIIAYTDDDTLPDPSWVHRISETFRDPTVTAMTGLVLAASLNTEAEIIFEKFWPFNRGYVARLFDRQFFNSTLDCGPPVWEIGAGANMAFRKAIFEEAGYFDERLDVGAAGCSGDSEMWYRILANGYNILYNPQAVVHHTHRNSIRELKKQLHSYMRGFTVAILIQYQRFGHKGNLRHLLQVLPGYYLSLLKQGFPHYSFQYKTLFAEMGGIFSGIFYYWRHRHTDPKIY